MTEKSYVQMLEDSLEKKCDILRQLQFLTQKQTEILQDKEASPEEFEENVNEKEVMIQRLQRLDAGFEQVFSKVEAELQNHREQYKDSILHMQEKIREITERSAGLQVMEKQNKELATRKFANIRSQARDLRQSGKAVSSYYQNMMKTGAVEPQFMDSKK